MHTMDAQEVEVKPGFSAVIEWRDGRKSFTGLFDDASEAWQELVNQRYYHEDSAAEPEGTLPEYSAGISRMWAITGVLDLLEDGEPYFRERWEILFEAEFGIEPNGVGQLMLPDPNNSERTITYRVEVS